MTPHPIPDADALDEAFATPRYLLLKHSTACPVSTRAFREFEGFLESQPDLPAGWIDVLRQRDLSRAVAARTGIRHESPQVLLLERGEVVWSESHFGISERSLSKAVGA